MDELQISATETPGGGSRGGGRCMGAGSKVSALYLLETYSQITEGFLTQQKSASVGLFLSVGLRQ